MEAPRKILIIRLSSIGDIVLTSPIIRSLAVKFPEASLHFLTKSAYADLLQAHPLLNKVHRFAGKMEATLQELEGEGFDLIVDLHRNLRSQIIKLRLDVKALTYPKDRWPILLYTKYKIGRLPERHTVDRYAAAIQPLGCELDGEGLDLYLPIEAQQLAAQILQREFIKPPLGVVLGGKYATKRWPEAQFIELLRSLDRPLLLLGGPEDKASAQRISQQLKGPFLNAVGQYSLVLSAALVQGCSHILSHDTGLMHIATAYNKPLAVLWGNTSPEIGFSPYKSNALNLEVQGLPCRPCTKLGFEDCPQGHFKCMRELSPATVLQKLTAAGWLD